METELLSARIGDVVSACERTLVPQFLGFLTEAEVSKVISRLSGTHAKYEFWGGHEDAERQMLAVLPEWCDSADYPITPLTFRYRVCDTLSHRDFLGALMALGIRRETIGDILVEKGRAVIFAETKIAEYILAQISKVGSVGVTVSVGAEHPLPQASKRVSCSDTVASLRLDCVIASLCGMSRSVAAQCINDGSVFIDSVCCQKPTHIVCEGNKINLRGKGRYMIEAADERSKKGRIILRYSKYI